MPNVLIGISGGIAAYKSCELVREFRSRGCGVRVMMTEAAQKFVTKLTFEALSGAPVLANLFDDRAFGTAHIEVARWADVMVVAPATADVLAKMAHGIANDSVTTVHLAFRGRVVVAPAMNTAMWEHPATRANLEILRSRGVEIVPPEVGELACGEVGPGKMAEPTRIVEAVLGTSALAESALRGKRIVVTAGPTREYIDPVRFISSPSTGKMGFAVAREALRRGAIVTVIHGPVTEKPDFPATFVAATSAAEMDDKVSPFLPADVFIGTAAVADFRPAKSALQKIKKQNEPIRLELEPTPDILASAGKKKRPGDLVVGFAAETEDVIENGKRKLEAKNLDLVVANLVERDLKGFAQDRTTVSLIDRSGVETFENVTKSDVARKLWDRIETLLETGKGR